MKKDKLSKGVKVAGLTGEQNEVQAEWGPDEDYGWHVNWSQYHSAAVIKHIKELGYEVNELGGYGPLTEEVVLVVDEEDQDQEGTDEGTCDIR